MKITSVNLKKIFPGQIQFTNTTVGMEASVDEGEDPSDVLEKLKEKITMWHLASEIAEQTKVKWDGEKMKMPYIDEPGQWKSEVPVIQVDKIEEKDPVKRGIAEAKTMDELRPYKKVAMNSGLMTDYVLKMKELTPSETNPF